MLGFIVGTLAVLLLLAYFQAPVLVWTVGVGLMLAADGSAGDEKITEMFHRREPQPCSIVGEGGCLRPTAREVGPASDAREIDDPLGAEAWPKNGEDMDGRRGGPRGHRISERIGRRGRARPVGRGPSCFIGRNRGTT